MNKNNFEKPNVFPRDIQPATKIHRFLLLLLLITIVINDEDDQLGGGNDSLLEKPQLFPYN